MQRSARKKTVQPDRLSPSFLANCCAVEENHGHLFLDGSKKEVLSANTWCWDARKNTDKKRKKKQRHLKHLTSLPFARSSVTEQCVSFYLHGSKNSERDEGCFNWHASGLAPTGLHFEAEGEAKEKQGAGCPQPSRRSSFK
ncbi:hypothetical protein OUZ56_000500 [Daphnia magna]|uniref:Uncharacterized protein n=1 Tax=Daphnia magna TaxID=35525 RepID=A0ABR0A009_9CRUS|nr:hypothetical protein OUZ56_000500 [Daphnia magna]